MEGSSSQQTNSRKKDRPVGPVDIHTDGKPYGKFYPALAGRISDHVTHCDEFSPLISWPEHKNSGRSEALYRELTPVFSLPDYHDHSQTAVLFRKWFNNLARHRFSDNKWRSLYRTYARCDGDPSIHVPDKIDSDTWTALCETYEKHEQEDESGKSKKEKCKASRKANDLDHHMGRDALSVWAGRFREARNKDPNIVDIYNKEHRKIDPLKAVEGELPPPDLRGRPVSDHAEEIGIRLGECYHTAIAEGSDESTASTRATMETFGRVTRFGLETPRGSRPGRRSSYTSQLEKQVETLTQSQAEMKEQWQADRDRLAKIEQSQKEFNDFMTQLWRLILARGILTGGILAEEAMVAEGAAMVEAMVTAGQAMETMVAVWVAAAAAMTRKTTMTLSEPPLRVRVGGLLQDQIVYKVGKNHPKCGKLKLVDGGSSINCLMTVVYR